MKIVKTEFRTDAAGTYQAFIYDDGHTETDPIGRPKSKEDLQRELRDAEALKRAKSTLANEHTRFTRTSSQLLAPTAQQIARAEFDVIAGGLLTREFNDAIRTFTEFASTSTATQDQTTLLASTVSLGGEMANGEGTEYIPDIVRARADSAQGEGFTTIRPPVENRPGHNNG